MTISVILLAGGIGSRMETATPKQFLELNGMPIALYSFGILSKIPEVQEIVVVCEQQYRHLFPISPSLALTFASPGKKRQDSVFNGLMATTTHPDFVCIHDSARPFITSSLVIDIIEAAKIHGAATAGTYLKATIKKVDSNSMVISTPDRSLYREIQTPQVIQTTLLRRGFEHATKHGLLVTDDVSLIEHLGLPVKIVEGSYVNFKITTTEDLEIANILMSKLMG